MSTSGWMILTLGITSAALLYTGVRLEVYTRSAALIAAIVVIMVTASMDWPWVVLIVVFLGTLVFWTAFGSGSSQKRTMIQPVSGAALASRLAWPTAMAAAQLFQSDFALFPAFTGALAVSTADIWATQIGLLSKDKPRLLTSQIPVPHGTAGAISTLGLVASLGGSWLIGLTALLTSTLSLSATESTLPQGRLWLPLSATIGGFVGMLVDSALAQTVQCVYYCDICKRFGEQEWDEQHHQRQRVRGLSWMNNEAIDLISTILGTLVTVLCLRLINQVL